MLSGKGYDEVYNLSGGIKGTNAPRAVGPPEQGLQLFDGRESVEEVLIVGFGLEQGLREFYLDMQARVSEPAAKRLFATLAEVEVAHQKRLLELYQATTGKVVALDEMAEQIVEPAMEGGLSTEEYLQLYEPDLDSMVDILSLAMSIEAQALDLYQRASERATDEDAALALAQVASEEREHLARLAEYMDTQ